LDLGEGLYSRDAIITNREKGLTSKSRTREHPDKTIAAPEIEFEAIEEISSHFKIPKNLIKGVRTGEVDTIAIDHAQSMRSDAVRKLLRLDHLNKEEACHVDRMIHKYNDLFRLKDVRSHRYRRA